MQPVVDLGEGPWGHRPAPLILSKERRTRKWQPNGRKAGRASKAKPPLAAVISSPNM